MANTHRTKINIHNIVTCILLSLNKDYVLVLLSSLGVQEFPNILQSIKRKKLIGTNITTIYIPSS